MTTPPERIEEVVEDILHKSIDYLSKQGEGYASFYVNILKAEITNTLHQELQKARESERGRCIKLVESCDTIVGTDRHRKPADTGVFRKSVVLEALQSELDQPIS